MRYEIRPLGDWPNRTQFGTPTPFRATWSDTLDLLGQEIKHLGSELVVIQVDAKEAEIRRDGMLRSGARVGYRGVRISFESKHGPLTYATDAFQARYSSDPASWQQNVRAIALSLQALRAVDRYGVSRSGEQYRGWTAIEARGSASHFVSRREAASFLAAASLSGAPEITVGEILDSPALARRCYRSAARRMHPDAGGTEESWSRLDEAARMLGVRS